MKQQILQINGYYIVITWGIDPLDSKRAFSKYFDSDFDEIIEWVDIPIKTRSIMSNAIETFCEKSHLINWSN